MTKTTPNKNLIHAARKQPVDRVPVWFMRQAGRSLPEYFPVRGEGSILDAISVPERAAEITLQPVRRYDVDAAILFSDIVTPIWASGFGIDITPGVGPECENPFSGEADLKRLRPLDPDADLTFQTDAIKILVDELDVPLIGFAGAPFTLAAYLIEGRPSRTYDKVKTLMMSDEKLWHSLCDRLADFAIATLTSQVAAGAEAIQLFDSWAGALHPDHYRRFVAPHSAKIFAAMADLDVPRFHFGINSGELLDQFAEVGPDVVGVDWHTSIASARKRTGNNVALQGNLDPAICLAPWDVVEAEVKRVLADNNGDLGYVFNLGHGVLPNTNPETLEQVVKLVHEIGTSYQKSEPGAEQ